MGYMDKYLPASNATAGNITVPDAAAPFDPASILVLIVTLCAFCAPVFVLFPPFPPRKSDALPITHTRLGLQPSKSNLRDRRAADHASPGAAEVRSLFIYPVKSCKGIEVTRAKVVHTGLEFDRLFTFAQLKSPFPVGVDGEAKGDHAWEFITQRQFPLLATVEVELWQPDLDKIRGGEREIKSDETFLVLRFPYRRAGLAGILQSFAAKCSRGWRAVPKEEVLLPVAFPSDGEISAKGYTREPVRVWKDTATALNMGSELPEELRRYLGVSNRLGLFRIDPAGPRPVFRCAPAKEEAGYQPVVSFQDSYPLHVLGLSSVRDLETQVKKDADLPNLDPKRFRANIFVSGTPAYDEDSWTKIRLTDPSHKEDQSEFHVSCRTTRCKLPNVNPATGIRHAVEPDRTLRANREIDEGAPRKGCLGMQVTPLFDRPESPESYLAVGMSIEVLERGEHFFKSV
ncbi:putative mosc domain-containing protein [Diaporthe ampelina]|uniref:Putative mosc domain-containing protein n=1 Tax=Diaporthe ampelina TaxID=1214573 RepID=A0A0G2HPT3_9PEZI|nr:putative mosc domain-containing protein [Diaporthe ampelina]